MIIQESNMSFGPFNVEECFRVEESKLYSRIKNSGAKTVEFILLRPDSSNNSLWFVEAKESTPNSTNPDNTKRFQEFINDVSSKLTDSLSLLISSSIGRHDVSDEIPPAIKQTNLSSCNFCFVLVIKGHNINWLPDLQNAFNKHLRKTFSTWKFGPTPLRVLNEDGARRLGLISETA